MRYRVEPTDKEGLSRVVSPDGEIIWNYILTSQAHSNCSRLNRAFDAGLSAGREGGWRTGRPEVDGRYVVSFDDGTVGTAWFSPNGVGNGWGAALSSSDRPRSNVYTVAWQPLPAAYANGDGDK